MLPRESKGNMLLYMEIRMKDERLERLSDMVRMGEPIDFAEAIEVIDYQMKLKQEQINNSWVNRVRRFFGMKNEHN